MADFLFYHRGVFVQPEDTQSVCTHQKMSCTISDTDYHLCEKPYSSFSPRQREVKTVKLNV